MSRRCRCNYGAAMGWAGVRLLPAQPAPRTAAPTAGPGCKLPCSRAAVMAAWSRFSYWGRHEGAGPAPVRATRRGGGHRLVADHAGSHHRGQPVLATAGAGALDREPAPAVAE